MLKFFVIAHPCGRLPAQREQLAEVQNGYEKIDITYHLSRLLRYPQ